MKKILISFLIMLSFTPFISFAADISFGSDKSVFDLNNDFLVQVFLDTKDVKVNAIEGKVLFPSQLLGLKEVRDGNSAVNFWVEKPESLKDGEVDFSGITTGGISSSKMFLLSLVFNAKSVGKGSVIFDKIQVLQNDGLGTKVETKINPFIFSVVKTENPQQNLKILDSTPPESFNLYIGKDTSVFDGRYFAVFSTTDKGSGIDHYEIKESFFGFDGNYKQAVSPYVLENQSLMKTITVVAFDKFGNQRKEQIGPQNRFAFLVQFIILAIILCICVFAFKKIWPRFLR